jgi:flagellar biosynthesis protein FlhA
VRDNLRLKTTEYRVKVRGGQVAFGELELESLCVIGAYEELSTPHAITLSPAMPLKCAWIRLSEREQALMQGLDVLSPLETLIKHVEMVLRRFAQDLLSRQEIKIMLEQLSERQPAVVEDIVPQVVSITLLHRVLKNLLKEGIPIRDLVTILETLAERARQTEDTDLLTEYVRQALARSISECYRSQGRIRVLALDPTLEEQILTFSKQSNAQAFQDPQEVRAVVARIREQAQKLYEEGITPIVLCRPSTRRAVRQLVEKVMPDLVVLSLSEITPDTELETQGVMSV